MATLQYRWQLAPGEARTITLRLARGEEAPDLRAAGRTVARRAAEADRFYAAVGSPDTAPEARHVMRQAFAGLTWSRQSYHYGVARWLDGDPAGPPPPAQRLQGRNHEWRHFESGEVLAMPDTWEYPWFASWDSAFHAVAWALIDPGFAKDQLLLLTREWYMHPNGQLPAYEWDFGAVDPPVQAWAALRVYQIERRLTGHADHLFLERDLPQAAAGLHVVGQPQGPRRPQRLRRAASWASTTSASSTATRACPEAAGWPSPTARRGWACSASRCWRSPASWPAATRPTRTWPPSSSSTSSTSGRPSTTWAGRAWPCGTRTTSSSTTSCRCPTAAPRRSRCARSWASSPCSPWAPWRPTSWTTCPTSAGACSGSCATAPTWPPWWPAGTSRASGNAASSRSSTATA